MVVRSRWFLILSSMRNLPESTDFTVTNSKQASGHDDLLAS